MSASLFLTLPQEHEVCDIGTQLILKQCFFLTFQSSHKKLKIIF